MLLWLDMAMGMGVSCSAGGMGPKVGSKVRTERAAGEKSGM